MRLSHVSVLLIVAALGLVTPANAMPAPVRPVFGQAPLADPQPIVARTSRAFAQDLGRSASTSSVRLAVVLHYRHEAELERFVELQGDPHALIPHMVLSAQQFRDYFSPSPADYQRALGYLIGQGMTVERTYGNRVVIDVSAPAAVVERIFSTEIHDVRQADGSRRYANVRPAYLPRALRDLVFGVIGFDDLRVLKTTYVRSSSPHALVKIGPPLQAPDLGLGPYAFSTAYDLPVQHAVAGGKPGQTYDGTGQAAAVVIDADFLDSDLQTFLNYFHVKRTGPKTVRVPINGGPPPGLIYPDSGETTLDVETIVSNAPGVALYVYEMDSFAYASVVDAYNAVNSDDKVGVVNSSFGGCEDQTDPANFPKIVNHLALAGNALGIVYDASTGDDGTFECSINFGEPGGVSSPASGTHFVAVGATTLFPHTNGTYSLEIGWYGSGGGVSDIFSRPTYQAGVPHIIGTTRNLPDIAFDGDPNSGAAFYIAGGWYGPIGGTSLSAPIFSALAAELAQYDHARLGNVLPAIYSAYRTYGYHLPVGATIFHDAVGRDNGYYVTTPGYDQVTGIGSIDGWNFAVTTHL